jgi:DNA invertase Pin-like site-specific DNA recombinase
MTYRGGASCLLPAYSLRVVAYPRVSSPGQSTIPEQEEWARHLARERGWPLVAVVPDEGTSGDAPDRLDAVLDLMVQHRRGGCPIDGLLVEYGDSLDTGELLAPLRREGLRFVVTRQAVYDLRDKADRMRLNMEQDFSHHPFLELDATRTLNGMAAVARAGYWAGRVPLGYRIDEASRR